MIGDAAARVGSSVMASANSVLIDLPSSADVVDERILGLLDLDKHQVASKALHRGHGGAGQLHDVGVTVHAAFTCGGAVTFRSSRAKTHRPEAGLTQRALLPTRPVPEI